jgi:streptogramin lyase
MCTPIAVRLVADPTALAQPCTKGSSRLLQRMRQALIAVAVLCVGLLAFSPIAEAQWVTASPAVGTDPYAVAVNPVTNTVYVANYSGNTVTVIDGATNNTTTVSAGI